LLGIRRLLVLLVVASVVVAAGVVSWDRWWRHAGPGNPGVSCPVVVAARHRRAFAAFGVHRVALIGDAIMAQASCAVADELRDLGIQTSRDAVSGSGLLTGSVNWVARTRQILRTEKPDVVVAIFIGNYPPPFLHDAKGAVIETETPAFYRAWQARAQLLSAEVHAAHVRMYWVSPPPITAPLSSPAGHLFDGYRTIKTDHVVDSGRVLEGPDGREVMTKETCGHERAIRAPDGVHLSDDGGRLYGQQIAHDLSADWGILTAPQPC
jgi:hypothetical protein